MQRLTLSIVLSMLLLLSCGENNGTPVPAKPPTTADGSNARTPMEARLAENSRWRAGLAWNQSPTFSDEQFIEMTGIIDILTADGKVPATVENVSLTADMPQHGHGTGNLLPRVRPLAGEPGRFVFENLFFSMTGSWRIRVLATVDGNQDVWSTTVDVKTK